jgi:hypothetical protein
MNTDYLYICEFCVASSLLGKLNPVEKAQNVKNNRIDSLKGRGSIKDRKCSNGSI